MSRIRLALASAGSTVLGWHAEHEKVKKLRGALLALKPIEAMERLLKSLAEYRSNAEFLEAI